MRFFIAITFVFLAILLSGVGTHADGISPYDERALRLRNEVIALYETETRAPEWRPEKGPWADYLLDDYASVLSDKERELYFRSLSEGNCTMVAALQEAATLVVFPYLVQAHSSKSVSDKFRETVSVGTDDHSACFKMWQVGKLLRFLKSKGHAVDLRDKGQRPVEALRLKHSFKVSAQNKPEEQDVPVEQRAMNSVCWSVRQLTEQAMKSSSIGPTKALVRLSQFPELLRLSDEQRFIIAKRAEVLGVDNPALLEELEDVYYRIGPKRRAVLEERAARPSWRIWLDLDWSCRFPLYSTRDMRYLP